ncbi:MAG: NAD(P)H-dependent glycerol-3-phosphate dehydrogenase [Spirochaetia bacterium]|jgi:glycerol-3-phosphate dehydrogenase (NAD(P)+)|nr:NAD(P)H-dependent glycerol-3-phosphate dehydrogenase [Spirochaetia bacterium]
MSTQVGIIGSGAWGTAMGKQIAQKGIKVQMWDFMKEVVDDINNNHLNSRYLPGIKLPPALRATTDILEAADNKDFLIIASPSIYLVDTVKKFLEAKDIREGKTTVGVITKGFVPSPSGPRLIVSTLEDYFPGFYRDNIVYIAGPSHAEEVAANKITGLISACRNGINSIKFRELLANPSLFVFSSIDVIGVQTCAATKNVIAIAFGMLDALKENSDIFGDNTESLLLAAGLNEIQKIGKALGATHPETFTSIAGVGDLDVTCRSIHGRNRRFGRDIVLKNILDQFSGIDDIITNISKVGYLPEGAVAAKFVRQIITQHKIKLPISNIVYKIINKDISPKDAITLLLGNTAESMRDELV